MAKTVLLVDDEPHILRVMSMGLRREGYTVLTAKNGEEGLRSFAENNPDAMVADVDMPKMNGIEMCSAITQQFPEHQCKIFMSTSRAETELREWATECGGIHFMEKPVSMRTLTAELGKHFAANDSSTEDDSSSVA